MGNTAFDKRLFLTAFSLLATLCLAMAVATFLELYKGTDFAFAYIYNSVWFCGLWFVASLCGAVYLVQRKIYRNLPVAGIHLALLLILSGALLTRATSKKGYIHLRKGESAGAFIVNGENAETTCKLPFVVTLTDFRVSTYAGTDMPSDYTSCLKIRQCNGSPYSAEISMNNIFKKSGVRLYQASYDEDMSGSTLSVNYDPYGTPATYCGYALLFLFFISWLFSGNGMMRKSLRIMSTKAFGVLLVSFVFYPQISSAQSQIVLPKKQTCDIGKLLIDYDGRIAPVETFARDFVKKITDGKVTYKGLTPEQILTGWIFFPNRWEDEDIISLKSAKVRDFLELERYTSYSKLSLAVSCRSPEEIRQAVGKKETDRLSEKMYLLYTLEQGKLMKMYPCKDKGGIRWFSYMDKLPATVSESDADFIRMSMTRIYGYLLMQKPRLITDVVEQISEFQKRHGGNSLPTETQLKCEHLLNAFPFTGLLFKVNILAGLLAFVVYIRKNTKRIGLFFAGVSLFTNLSVLAIIVLRTIVAGRVPLSNGYETMLVLAWLIQLLSLVAGRHIRLVNSFGLIGSGFMLLVASLQASDPKITPLMPVLSSPLLAIHVSVIMLSYALLSLTFITSLSALAFGRFSQKTDLAERLTVFVKVLLPPAVATLGTGIFIGAIWANVSWGSYWNWDSKEVWSLITFITYSFALHEKSFEKLKSSKWFNMYIVLAYLAVVMTYFGVNMILPGMHSYSGM